MAKEKNYWNLNELQCYLASEFDVVFAARSSYYDLFHEAGISWKQSQKKNPGKDPEAVAEKKEIEALLEPNRTDIEAGKLRIFFVDECHLLWGDVCGSVWGKTDQRIELPIKNEKEKQTYYGALDYVTGQVIAKPYPNGNTENTIKFVQELIREDIAIRIQL